MKHAVPHRRGLFLLAGVLLVLAGIAWGAAFRPRSDARHATASARVKTVKHPLAAVVAAPRVAASPSAVHEMHVVGEGGMRIYRDPQTGEIGPPTSDMAIAVEPGSSEDGSNLQQVVRPDGSAMINLQGRFQESMVIQLDANGKRVVRCVTDPKAALQQAPTLAPQREDK